MGIVSREPAEGVAGFAVAGAGVSPGATVCSSGSCGPRSSGVAGAVFLLGGVLVASGPLAGFERSMVGVFPMSLSSCGLPGSVSGVSRENTGTLRPFDWVTVGGGADSPEMSKSGF